MQRPSAVILAVALAAAATAAAASTARADATAPLDVRFSQADGPGRAALSYDDSDWQRSPLGEIPTAGQILWIRASIPLDEADIASLARPALRFVALASCQVFWDGAPLGENGRPAAAAENERPGQIDWVAPLPPLAPGRHLVALRCSTHHRGFDPRQGFYALQLGDYQEMVSAGPRFASRTLFFAGALFCVGVFYALTFALGGRRRPDLWLGAFALGAAALIAIESIRPLVGYSYDWHIVRLVAIVALAWLVNASLVLFVLARYSLPRSRAAAILFVVLSLACLALPGFDAKTGALFLLGLAIACTWCVRALARRRYDAGFAVAGLALCIAAAFVWPYEYLDYYLFVNLTALSLSLLASNVVATAREQREHRQVELRSARLEIELLRRQLQPHFLMNTLTALAEHFEQAPDDAARMLEHLGAELRLLADVSSQRLIALDTEVALCRSHLEVMARRRDERLELAVEVADGSLGVPPAIVHTLLENALTHNDYGDERARFALHQEAVNGRVKLRLDAPLGRARNHAGGGTGLRYVRARLRESFGDDFTLESAEAPAGASNGTDAANEADGSRVWRTSVDYPAVAPPKATRPCAF